MGAGRRWGKEPREEGVSHPIVHEGRLSLLRRFESDVAYLGEVLLRGSVVQTFPRNRFSFRERTKTVGSSRGQL